MKKENLKRGYYSTWQEASQAAISLKLDSIYSYAMGYHKDYKLPMFPTFLYEDFPGWRIFLNIKRVYELASRDMIYFPPAEPWSFVYRRKKNIYVTWEEASVAVKKIGIFKASDYKKLYHLDSMLPSRPFDYPRFPGWRIFLGTNFYLTWQEASKAVKRLGIKTRLEYSEKKIMDPMLPSDPCLYYQDKGYPGWEIFSGCIKKKREKRRREKFYLNDGPVRVPRVVVHFAKY